MGRPSQKEILMEEAGGQEVLEQLTETAAKPPAKKKTQKKKSTSTAKKTTAAKKATPKSKVEAPPPVRQPVPSLPPVSLSPREVKAPVHSKADYIKISPTIPPDMFDQLAMIQIRRRRQKKPFTMSDLTREAFTLWLAQNENG